MKTSLDPRHLARKVAFATIFSALEIQDINLGLETSIQIDIDQAILSIKDTYQIQNYDQKIYQYIINTAKENMSQIYDLIKISAKDWEIDKIYKPDYAILYIATAELISDKTPTKVIIDEAVELAKEFGIEESPKFVNGVLAGIVNMLKKDATN